MTKWSELTPDESLVDSTTEIVDLQNGDSNQRIRFSIPTLGQLVIPIHKVSDLPPLVNGFRTLEQDKVYQFVAEITIPDTLLIPAGWNGYIIGIHNPLTKLIYTGIGSALQTLGIDGTISSIADAGGGAITVTTSASHGLLDGQFVNITGTTSYNQQKLVVSNVTGTTFDVQIAFVANESGSFDTGYNTVNIMNMAFVGPGDQTLLSIEGADASSMLRYYNMKASGFEFVGVVETGKIIGYDGDLEFTGLAIVFSNMDSIILSTTTLTHLDLGSTGSPLLSITGSSTTDVVLDKIQFNVADPSQFAIRLSSLLAGSRISITNSPDNNIATDYFDTAGGGLDQTDPGVFAFNNGLRANSKNIASAKVVGNATSFLPTVSFDSFDFGTSAIAGTEIERWELVSSQTGRVRYIGTKPFSGVLNMQIGIDASAGKNYTITLEKNASTIPEVIGPVTISAMTSLVLVAEITAVTNDEFEPQILVDVTGDSIIAPHMSLIITET